MSEALNIIQDPTLTYKQELLALARSLGAEKAYVV